MVQVEDWSESDGVEEGVGNPTSPPSAEASKITNTEITIMNCLYLIVSMRFEKTGLQHSWMKPHNERVKRYGT
jgi:hypothetical protein